MGTLERVGTVPQQSITIHVHVQHVHVYMSSCSKSNLVHLVVDRAPCFVACVYHRRRGRSRVVTLSPDEFLLCESDMFY